MSGIVDFLEARLREDEMYAVHATNAGSHWHSGMVGGGEVQVYDAIGTPLARPVGAWSAEIGMHIAHFDPARALAEIAAKRCIIATYRNWSAPESWGPNEGRVRTDAYAYATQTELRNAIYVLAQPYHEHPDFQPGWAVLGARPEVGA